MRRLLQVFPELRAIGALHISIAQEFRYLQARIKAATPLLEMANKPFYRESPHTEKRLDAMQKNFLFLPMDPPKEDIYRSVYETIGSQIFLFPKRTLFRVIKVTFSTCYHLYKVEMLVISIS